MNVSWPQVRMHAATAQSCRTVMLRFPATESSPRSLRLGQSLTHTPGKSGEAHFRLGERSAGITRRTHAGLDARNKNRVFGVDLPIDAPVEIARGAHLSSRVGQCISDLADQGLGRRNRNKLHEIDLIGIDVEGDVW